MMHVSIIDPATGNQIGAARTFPGDTEWAAQFDSSRTRVTIVATTGNGASTSLIVVDTATGAQEGETLTLAGQPTDPVDQLFNADGTRSTLATVAENGVTQVAVIDIATGLQVGTTLTLPTAELTAMHGLNLSSDGSRAVATQARYLPVDAEGGVMYDGAWVTVIDTATGVIVGQPVSVSGNVVTEAQFTDRGDRIVFATQIPGFNTQDRTLVTVIDAGTGRAGGDDSRPTRGDAGRHDCFACIRRVAGHRHHALLRDGNAEIRLHRCHHRRPPNRASSRGHSDTGG